MKNNLEKILYSKPAAVMINTIFGICLWYTAVMIWAYFCSVLVWGRTLQYLVMDMDFTRFVAEFFLFIILWVALGMKYNLSRYQKRGGGRFFWLSTALPAALIEIIFWVWIFFWS